APAAGVTPLLRGTIVHQLLERFDLDLARAPEPAEVEEAIRAHGAPVTPDEVGRIRELIRGFARAPLPERAAAGIGARRAAPLAPVEESFAAADAPELEARLLELARGVLEGRFEPTPEPHRELCLTCPGRAALCSWGPEHTLREHPGAAVPS